MKKLITLLTIIVWLTGVSTAQSGKKTLPSVDIKTLSGETFNTSEITNDGPIFLSFWATWCKPCIKELIAIDENYIDWQDETGLKVYAVSIDDSKSMNRVAPFVNGRAWEFEVLLDSNSDFKRAMNVINIPHSFILDKNGKVVWQHSSYAPGDELEIYEIIKKLSEEDSGFNTRSLTEEESIEEIEEMNEEEAIEETEEETIEELEEEEDDNK